MDSKKEFMHTPEPWAVGEIEYGLIKQAGLGGAGIASTSGPFRGVPKEFIHGNARRIVACVNACAGVSTDSLEGLRLASETGKTTAEVFELLVKNLALTEQRDELLAVLKLMRNAFEFTVGPCPFAKQAAVISAADEIIAKCEVQS